MVVVGARDEPLLREHGAGRPVGFVAVAAAVVLGHVDAHVG